MENSGRTRWLGSAASGGKRGRGALAAFGAFAAAMLPACSGCQVDIERSDTTLADGVYSRLVVGGSEPDGAFVVARRERAPGDDEVVLVSLAEGERRTCSLGKAFAYSTSEPSLGFADGEPRVDARPARILTLEGELGAESGDLRIFDASCTERLRVPSVMASRWPKVTIYLIHDGNFNLEAYAAGTTAGEVVWIDPWAGAARTIAEGVSFWRYYDDKFWLIEDGRLVVRDRDGKTLQTAGTGVTELEVGPLGAEVAYVDENGLWVLKLGEDAPMAIPTKAAPCHPDYISWTPPKLAYREDCAAGVLAVLDRTTGDKRVFDSGGVTSVLSYGLQGAFWLFFEREEPGKKRELWAVREDDEPVLVGTDPKLEFSIRSHGEGFFFVLDHDGTTGTLGTWTLQGGFSPLVEGYAGEARGPSRGYLAVLADAQEDVGTLVVFNRETLTEAFRVPRVHQTPLFSRQAPALGYVHDWDDTLGAGTFTAWIPVTGQKIDVDTGVTEFAELIWPEPGIVYAVRTPERAGLWTAYPDL
ncbi:hypothetical protein [Polyangium mundeleinium]|uniref:Lipoprotein n=1 Tax=Polyangium mundeleinium TaxID=2995306 RepID=A0ABT5ELS9_9BACT|nr:hypothetical protein [Polyangium mundeleinium]MDC0742800.1 hypothetical protein [Polyangium mundeleinium]